MANRKRNIQLKIWLNEDEQRLIDEKMKLLPTSQIGAYIRKMAIDGYVIYTVFEVMGCVHILGLILFNNPRGLSEEKYY